MAKQFWAVGASFKISKNNYKDMSGEFLTKEIWFDGYAASEDNKDDAVLKQLNVGDYLIMKSSSTKGPKHSISFTKVKGIGEIISKDNYYSFKMKWYEIPELPIDFEDIWYSKTVEEMRDDAILDYAKRCIAQQQ